MNFLLSQGLIVTDVAKELLFYLDIKTMVNQCLTVPQIFNRVSNDSFIKKYTELHIRDTKFQDFLYVLNLASTQNDADIKKWIYSLSYHILITHRKIYFYLYKYMFLYRWLILGIKPVLEDAPVKNFLSKEMIEMFMQMDPEFLH
jgi:hypothetical protein